MAPPATVDASFVADAYLATDRTIVLYGANWCAPCQQAAAFLSLKRVRFVERGIEADHGAAKEMHSKLSRAGLRGGSIPVLDVGGRILVGFNPQAVSSALARPL